MLRFLIPLLFLFALPYPTLSQNAAEIRQNLLNRLIQQFDHHLKDFPEYNRAVNLECAIFPEGNLYPYTFPALAYGNLAIADHSIRPKAIAAMEKLLPAAARAFESSGSRRIAAMKSYGMFATELGQLNQGLSLYRHLGGTRTDLLRMNDHISGLLLSALRETSGAPIASYPNLTWSIDTVPCIQSLLLWKPDDAEIRQLADQHVEWTLAHGLDSATGLPWAESSRKLPRGCDLSWRLALFQQFAPETAAQLYPKYVEHFWQGAGFREWRKGTDHGTDIDSGPIVNGLGMGATGNGLAVALAMKDEARSAALLSLFQSRDLWIGLYHTSPEAKRFIEQEVFAGFTKFDPTYFTGFLFGDVALFHAISWPDLEL